MFRLAWATDIHLNFAEEEAIGRFLGELAGAAPDALALAGDLAEAASLADHLRRIEAAVSCPVYFVLGNHDFYGGSIAAVRAAMAELSARSERLRWLPAAGPVMLTERTGLVGHDGWGDGRLGRVEGEGSELLLNDDFLIRELAWLELPERMALLNALGDEAAAFVREALVRILDRDGASEVVLVTHVPPFGEACGSSQRPDIADWLPRFACKAVGDALLEILAARPDRRVTVLCGHTHGSGAVRILPNLEVRTGGATYGAPSLQAVLELP